MTTLRIGSSDGPFLDDMPLGEVRRWTVDKVAGEPPRLYVETVGDADLVIPGVEVVHNIVGGAPGVAIAEWLSRIDPAKLEAVALENDDMGTSLTSTILATLAKMAVTDG